MTEYGDLLSDVQEFRALKPIFKTRAIMVTVDFILKKRTCGQCKRAYFLR